MLANVNIQKQAIKIISLINKKYDKYYRFVPLKYKKLRNKSTQQRGAEINQEKKNVINRGINKTVPAY
jgi:hypothetical protein